MVLFLVPEACHRPLYLLEIESPLWGELLGELAEGYPGGVGPGEIGHTDR